MKSLRLLLAAGCLTAAAASFAAVPLTVGLDLSGLSDTSYRELEGLALEQQVTLRLVEEGFTVQAVAAAPTVVIRLRSAGDRLAWESTVGATLERREVARGEGSLGELHLELTQKAIELARIAREQAAPEAPPPPAPTPELPPPEPARWTLEPGLLLGVSLGPRYLDPLVGLGLGFGPPTGLRLQLSACGRRTWSDALDAAAGELLLGGAFRLALSERTWLDLGLLAGPSVEAFRLRAPAQTQRSGVRYAGLAAASLGLGFRPLPRLGLSVELSPRVASSAARHLVDGQVVAEGELVRLHLGAGAWWSF